jgi:hypothetical protein
MTPITLVMAYYMNPSMLARHYKLWEEMDVKLREHVHVVVVDDGSPTGSAYGPPDALRDMSIQVYRIDVDVRWNQDAARNIGVAHAETNWVLLTDIDHIVRIKTWRFLTSQLELDTGNVYKFRRVSEPELQPYKPHPNSWLMPKKTFDAAGGYEERFAGLYGTDGDFRDRVVPLVKEVVHLKESIIRVPRQVTPDASTTTYLRKQPEDSRGLPIVRRQIEEMKQKGNYKPLNLSFPYHRVYPK